ncbi:40S ribosomal protein S21 [Trifolium repens]|nr:40S ribosomal protein S21 [Trifolium repens]
MMQNEEGKLMELYIPRQCSATSRLIIKEHTSVKINIGHLDETGICTGPFFISALHGFIPAQGNHLWLNMNTETMLDA